MRFDQLKTGDRFCFGDAVSGHVCMKIEVDRHVHNKPSVNFLHLDGMLVGVASMSDSDIEVTKVE